MTTDWNDASHGDSSHDGTEVRDTEAQRGAPAGEADADGTPGPAVAEEPTVGDAERQRLMDRRAELVERRRVIVSGKARDDYAAAIARIDRKLRRPVAGQ